MHSYSSNRYFGGSGRGPPRLSVPPSWNEMGNRRPNHRNHDGPRPSPFEWGDSTRPSTQENLSNHGTKAPRLEWPNQQQQSLEGVNFGDFTGFSVKTEDHASSYRDSTGYLSGQAAGQHLSPGDSREKADNGGVVEKSVLSSTPSFPNLRSGISPKKQKNSPSLAEQQRYYDGPPGDVTVNASLELWANQSPKVGSAIERRSTDTTDTSTLESTVHLSALDCNLDSSEMTPLQPKTSEETLEYPWLSEFVDHCVNGEWEQTSRARRDEQKSQSDLSKNSFHNRRALSAEPHTASHQANERELSDSFDRKQATFNGRAGEIESPKPRGGICGEPTRNETYSRFDHGPIRQQADNPIKPECSIRSRPLIDLVGRQEKYSRADTENLRTKSSIYAGNGTIKVNENKGIFECKEENSKSASILPTQTCSSASDQILVSQKGSDERLRKSAEVSLSAPDSTGKFYLMIFGFIMFKLHESCDTQCVVLFASEDDEQTNPVSMDRIAGIPEHRLCQERDDFPATVPQSTSEKLCRFTDKSVSIAVAHACQKSFQIRAEETKIVRAIETQDGHIKRHLANVDRHNDSDMLSIGCKQEPVAAEIAYADFVEGGRCSIFVRTAPVEKDDGRGGYDLMSIDDQGLAGQIDSRDCDDISNSVGANETIVETEQEPANIDGYVKVGGEVKASKTSHKTGLNTEEKSPKKQKQNFDKSQTLASCNDSPCHDDTVKITSSETNTVDSERMMHNTQDALANDGLAPVELEREAQNPNTGADDMLPTCSSATLPDSTSKRNIHGVTESLHDVEKESRKPTTTKVNTKRKRFKPIIRANTKKRSQPESNQQPKGESINQPTLRSPLPCELPDSTPVPSKLSTNQTSQPQSEALPKQKIASASAAAATGAHPAPGHPIPPKETRYVFRESNFANAASSSTTKPRTTPRVPAPRTRKRATKPDQFNLRYSNEDALEAQERLFREAAARVRAQAHIRVTSGNNHSTDRQRPSFEAPVVDVATRYPDHWKYTDYFARLGLPKGAPLQSIKLQYRKLVLIYHPDKSKDVLASTKFQAITEAYRSLVGR